MRRTSTLLITLVLCTACRDGVSPYELPVRGDDLDFQFRQLTFGYGQDRDPQWMPNSQSLIYHTDQYGPLLTARGALLQVGAGGGTALPVIDEVQRTGGRLLATPAVSPDGSKVAYLDLISIDAIIPCSAVNAPLSDICPSTQPVLDSAALRIRQLDSNTPPASDPALGIKFAGVDPALRMAAGSPYRMQAFPFQQLYRDHLSVAMRPSWSPDNRSVAFSDGLNINIWRVGDATAVRVPNTQDGVSVAWSPDGERLVFTRLLRVDSTVYTCSGCSRGPNTSETHVRTVYDVETRVISVRIDGTGLIDFGAGDEPAWSPDSRFVYMRRADEIVRVPAAGGEATPVLHTAFGRAPAISPDGRWIAFMRRKPQLTVDWDIWVASLSQ